MNAHISITDCTEEKKYYLRRETDSEGIARLKASPASLKEGIELCRTRVEGKLVPAMKFAVDRQAYLSVKREEWKQEDRYRQSARCIIRSESGTLKRCPYRALNLNYNTADNNVKSILAASHNMCDSCPYQDQIVAGPVRTIPMSCMEFPNEDGVEALYEPESPEGYFLADDYLRLLRSFVRYLMKTCPEHPEYAMLAHLLGYDYSVREAAGILKKPQSTLYGWKKRIRKIYDTWHASLL